MSLLNTSAPLNKIGVLKMPAVQPGLKPQTSLSLDGHSTTSCKYLLSLQKNNIAQSKNISMSLQQVIGLSAPQAMAMIE